MFCGSCTYYDNDICYKKGTRVVANNNICEDFVHQYITVDGEDNNH